MITINYRLIISIVIFDYLLTDFTTTRKIIYWSLVDLRVKLEIPGETVPVRV